MLRVGIAGGMPRYFQALQSAHMSKSGGYEVSLSACKLLEAFTDAARLEAYCR